MLNAIKKARSQAIHQLSSLAKGLTKESAQALHNAKLSLGKSDQLFQSDQCSYDIVHRQDIVSVRRYHPLTDATVTISGKMHSVSQEQHKVPLVLVPPLGVHAWVFDLLFERSLVKFFLAKGYDLYLIDWGVPTSEHSDIGLDQYVLNWMPNALQKVRDYSKQEELSLMGYCMGGLLAMLYLGSSEDKDIRNLVTIASPIDVHNASPAVKMLSKVGSPFGRFTNLTKIALDKLDNDRFHLSGDFLSFGFKMTNPVGSISSYFDLLRNLNDRDYVAEYTTVNRWFNEMVDYPGATVRNMITEMGLGNSLAKGQFNIADKTADLGKINSNLLAFAGDNDKIVSIEAAKEILKVTSSEDKTFAVVPGGHAGVFAGKKASDNTWSISEEWLAKRSA